MAITLSKKADFTVLECDGELTIFNVKESHKVLLDIFKKIPERMIVDLSALQDFDSAGLQLLWWLKVGLAETTELTFSHDDNDVVKKVLDLYQLDAALAPYSLEVKAV